MVESITFEPQNVSELKLFFEDNKEKYLEIWVVITKKKAAISQPLSFDQALTEAKKQGLIVEQKLRCRKVHDTFHQKNYNKNGLNWDKVN